MSIPSRDSCEEASFQLAALKFRISQCTYLVFISHFFCLRGCVAISLDLFVRSVEELLVLSRDCLGRDSIDLASYVQSSKDLMESKNTSASDMVLFVIQGMRIVNDFLQCFQGRRLRTKVFVRVSQKSLYAFVIVSLLIAFLSPRFLSIREHVKISRAKTQLEEMKFAFMKVKDEYKLPLSFYSGTDCSVCPCRSGKDVTSLAYGETCRRQWREISTKVLALAGWDATKIAQYYSDPWGAPYGLNESDQFGTCREDSLISAGPAGRFETTEQITVSMPSVFCNERKD